MTSHRIQRAAALALTLLTSACVSSSAIHESQGKDGSLLALKNMYSDLKRSYYDANFHGQDMERQYAQAREAIMNAQSDQERFRALNGFLLPLNDSHTMYLGANSFGIGDYGFGFRFYGEAPLVTAVNHGMTADSAGLRVGDKIVRFAGKTITRDNYLPIIIEFLGQNPIPPLELEVAAPDNSHSMITLKADTAALIKMKGGEFRQLYASYRDSLERARSHISASIANKVFYWKLPEFGLADIKLGAVARTAGKHEFVILDLRGNPGGPIDQLKEVLNFFVDKPTPIGTVQSRWDKDEYVAKPKGDAVKSKLFVLTDSETGSAAEVCARLLQLDRGATVIGDRTAGAVMVASQYGFASITISDFILHNGERLEKTGVQPDMLVIPTQRDIAAGADPVLAFALKQAGVTMSSKQAARIPRGR